MVSLFYDEFYIVLLYRYEVSMLIVLVFVIILSECLERKSDNQEITIQAHLEEILTKRETFYRTLESQSDYNFTKDLFVNLKQNYVGVDIFGRKEKFACKYTIRTLHSGKLLESGYSNPYSFRRDIGICLNESFKSGEGDYVRQRLVLSLYVARYLRQLKGDNLYSRPYTDFYIPCVRDKVLKDIFSYQQA